MQTSSLTCRSARNGFTLMEILVVIAIITVLAAIAYPIITKMRANSMKAEALSRMKALAAAMGNYASVNDGIIPAEDTTGKDTWQSVTLLEAEKAWYNALPKLMGHKTVADFSRENRTAAFYTAENVIWLPGAQYPEKRIAEKPYFAIAINTKLHRRKEGESKGEQKEPLRLQNVVNPARTVCFIEQGMPGEPKAFETIDAKNDYDGSCKGSAKSFVARYSGRGVLAFFDGHCEEVAGKDLLTPQGTIIWDLESAVAGSLRVLWTADPKEDPNQKPNK